MNSIVNNIILKGVRIMGYKRNINENVRRRLYACSGNICAMYGCNNKLVIETNSNISEICHIEAISESGARYNADLNDEYINSYDNLILLCPTCHAFIDDKLNQNVFTVDFIKKMKSYHEQQVREALMNKAAISPPILLENYDLGWISDVYNYMYNKKISEKYVKDVLKKFFELKEAIRSVLYKIAVRCGEKEKDDNEIDVSAVYASFDLPLDQYAETLYFLEKYKIIEEVKYVDKLDGYEDKDGYWCLVSEDYLFKTVNGIWCLKKAGKLFVLIYQILKNEVDFYDLIVNRNIKVLQNINIKNGG